ncbi:MAG: V-type ATP synthase subunit I [Candidatus Parvarchaeota archaeon]|nr:V-type ATP synthase subunit I [Candidatus Parvarchaeota archaeon]
MFRPAKIVKIRIFVTKKNYEELMDILNDTASMHVEPIGEYDKSTLKGVENGEEYMNLNRELQRIKAIEKALPVRKPVGKVEFKDVSHLLSEAKKLKIDRQLSELIKNNEHNKSMRKMLLDRLEILRKLEGFKEDISILSNSSVSSFIITRVDKTGKENPDINEYLKDYVLYNIGSNTIASVKKSKRDEFAAVCKSKGISIVSIPQLTGKVQSLLKDTEAELKTLEDSQDKVNRALNSMSDKYYNTISAIREQLEIETEKLNVATKFGSTESVIVVEGWIEDGHINQIKRLFSKTTKNQFVFERIKTDELAPTKLQNPRRLKLFESFIRFYSLPKSNEIDPTMLFGVIFPIFFGFMVGDIGYGLFMFLAFFWLAHRITYPPKHSHIPKKLARFVHTILSNRGLLILSKSVMIGSIVAIVFGLIFGEFFGFKLPYTPIFNVDSGVATLLLISGWIGVAMVEFGYLLGVINKMYIGDRKGAIGRIGWAVAAVGIVILGLNVLSKASIVGISSVVSYILLPIGVILILKSEGSEALMELPSLISHILSYMRLVGILLASVILAEVVDKIFLADVSASFAFALVGGMILVLGQLFNIAIAIFEAGIQGARLIYVEFFSKFFIGNGKIFKPFGVERRRTKYKFRIED